MDLVRGRVTDELDAMEALLGGQSSASIRDRRGRPGLVVALESLPSIRPLPDAGSAQRALDELDGLELVLAHEVEEAPESTLRAGLAQLEDLDESVAIAVGGAPLSVVELIGVAELCRVVSALAGLMDGVQVGLERGAKGDRRETGDERELSSGSRNERGFEALRRLLCGTRERLPELPELLRALDRAIDRSPRGGGEPRISSAASEALAAARKQVRSSRQALLAKAERSLRTQSFAECLRDGYWTERDGRVVFPIRSDALGKVRQRGAIIHGSSGSGHTFFVEPGHLVEDNNALREAELNAAEEERKVMRRLSAEVAEHAQALRTMQAACVQFDLCAAKLALGARYSAITPELTGRSSDGGSGQGEHAPIELRAARHPLMLIDGIDVVPNDLLLARGHGLVVSGPNAGGKTVALKTMGLCALMAAAGLRLPCRGRARLPVFRRVVTDVGDDQSIIANLSTFSAHIGHVLEALRQAERDGAGTLVLLDEVAVGTDPEQGAALAEAILTELVTLGATLVVTTHYDRLKLLATRSSEQGGRGAGKFHNAAVGFDIQRMRPTFRLSLGVPGSSSALAVAERLGMPKSVLAEAQATLGDEGVKVDELLREIEAERASLGRARELLERELAGLERRDSEVRTRERRVLDGVRSHRAKAYVAATDELRALERELKHRRRGLRDSRPERVSQLPTRAQISADARTALARHRAQTDAETEAQRGADERLDARTLELGDEVRVRSMKQEGVIVALSGASRGRPAKRVTVQLQLMRTTVKPADLEPVRPQRSGPRVKRGKSTPVFNFKAVVTAQAARHFGDSPMVIETSVDNSCDVRGERFEDAQDRVADFVAQAMARDQDVILIRHGHGAGALRKAVRECLSRSPNVRKQRPGLAKEGGDAVTVAWVE